ncbi:MAG: hypothetical protein GY781_07935, partial [Gammaproteobacteria bacterium]|nr:hypothetical protein [Gammaproteobacteria bacterium]
NATANITDNDNTVLTVANVTVNEAAGTLTFDVVADKAVAGGFTVDYNFTDIEALLGTDFSDAGTGTLTFSGNAGEIQQVTVNIANDTLFESDETFRLNLTNASNARVDDSDTAIGTITDNDGANAVLSVTQHGSETGPTTIIYTVTLNNTNNTGSAISFDLTDAGTGTATSGTDYTAFGGAGVISVANGASTGQLVVVVADDALSEDTETVDATLTNASDADVTITGLNATANITDNDNTLLTVANVTVNEADGTLTFDVVADKAVPGGFTVDYNFTDIEAILDTDFSDAGTGTLTFSG